MKRDKKQDIRNMTDSELTKRLGEITKELVESRMQLVTGALKNVHHADALHKEMAFIKTLQTERSK